MHCREARASEGANDEGLDDEPIGSVGTLRYYHHPPTPAGARQVYGDSTNITNEKFGCLLKLTEDEIYDMHSFIYGCLRKDTSLAASENMTVTVEIGRRITEEQVICKPGEPIKYFYLPTGKYTEPLLARPEQLVVAKYPELFRELEGDNAWYADEKTDQYGRYDKAPWFYHHICLDRMFYQCMAEMKSHNYGLAPQGD